MHLLNKYGSQDISLSKTVSGDEKRKDNTGAASSLEKSKLVRSQWQQIETSVPPTPVLGMTALQESMNEEKDKTVERDDTVKYADSDGMQTSRGEPLCPVMLVWAALSIVYLIITSLFRSFSER